MAFDKTAFWRETGKQMGIFKDLTETDLSFCCRVMLSALSNWTLTAVGGSEQTISVVSIQQLIVEKISGYI